MHMLIEIKKIVSYTLLPLILLTQVHGAQAAQLQLKLTGNFAQNAYFICLPSLGCVSLYAGCKQMQKFILDAGQVTQVYVMQRRDFRRYSQPLPASCAVSVDDDQTLVVTGKFVVKGDDVTIKNLQCELKKT
jgi:hypothetical protein